MHTIHKHTCMYIHQYAYRYTYTCFILYTHIYVIPLKNHTGLNLLSLTPFDSHLRHIMRTIVSGIFIMNNFFI